MGSADGAASGENSQCVCAFRLLSVFLQDASVACLRSSEVDGATLLELTADDLRSIGITVLGQYKKILRQRDALTLSTAAAARTDIIAPKDLQLVSARVFSRRLPHRTSRSSVFLLFFLVHFLYGPQFAVYFTLLLQSANYMGNCRFFLLFLGDGFFFLLSYSSRIIY
jgi:hypothetical protein